MAKRRHHEEQEIPFVALMDTMTNVVGVLIIVLVLVGISVASAVKKILTDLPPVTKEQLEELQKIMAAKKEVPNPEELQQKIAALEVNVRKGTEDLGVHYFQRLSGNSLASIDWSIAQRVACPLPLSPLSYEGKLVTISWCVRVRFFLSDGTELMAQQPFYLGTVTRKV